MSFGRACHADGKAAAEFVPDKGDKLRCVVQIAARAGPAEGKVAAQSKHMVDAVVQVGLQLFTDAVLRVADTGKMRHGDTTSVCADFPNDFQIFSDVGAACAIGARDVVRVERVELFEDSVFTAELVHPDIGFGREDLKRERVALLHSFRNSHNFTYLLSDWNSL